MSTNSIGSLNQKKQYVHFVVSVLDKIRSLFGPSIATAWEVFYTESRATHGVLRKTYSYLAAKMGCSRRTVIRYAKKMAKAGVLIINHMFNHDCNLENEFILLTPEEALCAANNAPDRAKPDIDIDYSVDYSVENTNSVDKSVTSCHPSILTLNKDINNTKRPFAIRESRITEPKTVITALRQEETQKSVSQAVVNKIKTIVKAIPGVSNPSELAQEAIHFVANRKEGYSEWRAVGAFKRILNNNGWTTPFSMRKK